MNFIQLKELTKIYLMNEYDVRPSLAEKTVEVMFNKAAEYISLEEQREKKNG